MKYKAIVLLMILILLTNIAPFIFIENINIVLASPSSLETIEVSQPVQLTTDPSYDRDSSFLEDQYGTYWLFFTRGRNDTTNPDNDFYDIYYLKSTNGGNTWTEHSLPSSINDNYGQREVAAFEYEDLIVVYFTDAFWTGSPGAPTKGIYRVYSNDNGTTWSSVLQVPGITGNHIDAIAALGKIWVFYEDLANLINVISWDSGTGWSTPVQISESGKHGGIPKAMLDEDDDLNVVWCCWEASPVGGIYRSTSSDGITWTPPQQILASPSGIYACDPVLVQDLSETYWMFWAPWDSATDSQWLEVVNSTDGTTWSNSRRVTSGGYGGNYWWDMWPEAYVESSGDMLLFYDSGVSGDGAGGYTKGDGNIWMFKVDWDLTNDHYEFIQNAIDSVSSTTINVYPGVYNERVTVNKAGLTLKSVSQHAAVIKPTTTPPSWLSGAVLITADGVTIDGFEVDGTTMCDNGINAYGASDVTIINNIVHNTTHGWDGMGIAVWDWSGDTVDNALIENNTVYNTGRMGILVLDYDYPNLEYDVTENNIIRGNTVYDTWLVGWGDHGGGIQINVGKGCSITDNLVYNTINSRWGIYMFGSASGNTITDNTLRDNQIGIGVWISGEGGTAIDWEGDTAISPEVHYNNIYDNTNYGAASYNIQGTNMTLDARFNWWGDASGPYHNTSWTYMGVLTIGPNYGSGDRVTDYVLYEPWLQSTWPPTTLPTLRVEPSSYAATSHHETFDINITVSDILKGMGVQAIQFRLQFNATMLEVAGVTEGPFMDQAGDAWFIALVEYDDPRYGTNTIVGSVLLPQQNTTEGGIYTDFPEGSGTVATITFRAIYQQIGLENPPLACDLTLNDTLIINVNGWEIDHNTEDGYYEIWPWPRPTMWVEPESYTAKMLNETIDIDIKVDNLHASLMKPVAVQFRLMFNSTLLEVEDVTEGPLIGEAGPTYFIYFVEYDDPTFGSNTIVGTLLLPENETGQYDYYANGTGTIATVTFKSVYQHVGLENPPLACNLTLTNTLILDENMEDINHTIENWGTYEIIPNNIADINWDYKVDMMDVGIAARAFGSSPGHERWNPICDINGDGKVDMRDIAVVARQFGWTPDP